MGAATAEGNEATAVSVPGLRYVTDDEPGYRRRRSGRGFVYFDERGKRIADRSEIDRLNALAIPPAWTQVWICSSPNGHILATGRDAKGRKQYRYHPKWRKVRDESKFERTIAFGDVLAGLRRRVRKDLARTGLPKEKVVATVVALLDCCFARVGNEEYAKANGSFGLTTLRDKHVRFTGTTLRLRFKGKGGKEQEMQVDDPRIVHVVRRCRDIPGQVLFQFTGDDGEPSPVASTDVNDYLREVTGAEFSAKDFRTWAGTVTCAQELARADVSGTEAERNRVVLAAVDAVAGELGNTRTVSRTSYIHPEIIAGYLDGSLAEAWERRPTPSGSSGRGLRADERFTLAFLKARSRRSRRAA